MTTFNLATHLPLATKAVVSGLTSATAVGIGRPILCSVPRASAAGCSTLQARHFSSTPAVGLKTKQWFPPPEASRIKYAGPAWEHPVYSEEKMNQIAVAHREARNWSDRVALGLMRVARWGMDTATGYAEEAKAATPASWRARPMDERKWLIRIVFLESVAGVPGMVGGMLRHLHSLRRMRRDNGWIETLLEEAYNERMHLLTFLKLAEPGWFMKLMILGAQGVFFNAFFLAYLASPRTCHRFVGYLEEEAVYTYSRIIREMDAGNLPRWTDKDFLVPDIAIRYWNMPEGRRTMRDLMLYVRADEAKHREVNHTLGNLNQNEDPNPYVSEYVDPEKPHPIKGVETDHQLGWERKEVIGKD